MRGTMTMTVGELKEILEEYGDDMPVQVTVVRGDSEKMYADMEVESTSQTGSHVLYITVED
jgi:hypothetical protein